MQTEAKLNAQVTAGEARNKAAWFSSQAKDNGGQELQTTQDMGKRTAAMQAAVITKEAEKRKSRVRSGPNTSHKWWLLKPGSVALTSLSSIPLEPNQVSTTQCFHQHSSKCGQAAPPAFLLPRCLLCPVCGLNAVAKGISYIAGLVGKHGVIPWNISWMFHVSEALSPYLSSLVSALCFLSLKRDAQFCFAKPYLAMCLNTRKLN